MQYLFQKLPTLSERVAILYTCQHDPEFRQQVLDHCSENLVWFVQTFGWTYYPWDIGSEDKPFLLFDYQTDYLHWLEGLYKGELDGLTEKCREMGATWLLVAWAVWHWLFDDSFLCRFGSNKEDNVDQGTIDGIFGKIRYFIKQLPGWMLPNGLSPDKHFTHMKVVRPDRDNNILSGESSNQNFARSGRFHVVIFDEMAFWPQIKESWSSAGQSTRCRIACSTPDGKNEWYRMVDSGNYQTFRMEWWMDPRKDQEWFEKQKLRYTDPVDFNREIMISYEGSITGVVYPYAEKLPLGAYPYEKGWNLYTSWDFGLDETSIVWWAENPETGKVRIVDCYWNSNKVIDWYVPFLTGQLDADNPFIDEYSAEERFKITQHRTWPIPLNFGDPSGNQRNVATGKSTLDRLLELGVVVYTQDGSNRFLDRKQATDLGLRQIEGINIPAARRVYDALRESRYPPRDPDGNYTSEIRNPVHNWTSHFRTAVEYFFVNYTPTSLFKRPKSYRRKMAYANL